MRLAYGTPKSGTTLTATMLTQPMTKTTIPEPMTSLQNGRPSDFWLVASLFKLPRVLFPVTSMTKPKKLNPCAGLSSGQSLAKYSLKKEHSDTIKITWNLLANFRGFMYRQTYWLRWQ
jgi:hypothetical protein